MNPLDQISTKKKQKQKQKKKAFRFPTCFLALVWDQHTSISAFFFSVVGLCKVFSPGTVSSIVHIFCSGIDGDIWAVTVTHVTGWNIEGLLSAFQTIPKIWHICILLLLSVFCTLPFHIVIFSVLKVIPDFWYPSLSSSVNTLARWIAGTMWWTIFHMHSVLSSCS